MLVNQSIGIQDKAFTFLKRNIRDERETSATTLTPEHKGERADSAGKWTDLKIWTVAMDPIPVCVSLAPKSSALGKTGQGTSLQGLVYCSASLRGYHECQALMLELQSTLHKSNYWILGNDEIALT